MKKLLALLIVAVFASSAMATEKAKAPTKPAVKKEVKHHKKADGTKIADTKPDTVVPKKKKESKNDALNVLRHYMDDSKAQKIFNEMEESRKGDKVEKEVLKIIKI